MSADTLAPGSLNSFAGLAGQVQPEEIFVLTSSQLEQIISRAVARAQAPLLERIERLESRLNVLPEEGEEPWPQVIQERPGGQGGHIPTFQIVHSLQAENHALKRELCDLQEATARERAYDRQRIARLERVDPQPLQKDRGEILHALIATNGGKMLAKDARKKMHLSESRFSELLTTMKDQIEVKPFHLKKSQNVVILI